MWVCYKNLVVVVAPIEVDMLFVAIGWEGQVVVGIGRCCDAGCGIRGRVHHLCVRMF